MFQDALSPDQENLDLANVNLMLELLVQKKKQLEAVRKGSRGDFILCFSTPVSFSLHFGCLHLHMVGQYSMEKTYNDDYFSHK